MICRWLRARRERRLHNPQDPDCKYWIGDMRGFNLSAICPICGTKAKQVQS